MTTISRRNFGKLAFGSALMMSGFGFTNVFAQTGKTAICYNVPAEWAGWGNMLQLIAKETGINVPIDNKNSGQSVSQVIAEAKNPVADAMYLGISFAINAKKPASSNPSRAKAGSLFRIISRIPTATGFPSTQARSASWSTKKRWAMFRSRRVGKICWIRNTTAWSASWIRLPHLSAMPVPLPQTRH